MLEKDSLKSEGVSGLEFRSEYYFGFVKFQVFLGVLEILIFLE